VCSLAVVAGTTGLRFLGWHYKPAQSPPTPANKHASRATSHLRLAASLLSYGGRLSLSAGLVSIVILLVFSGRSALGWYYLSGRGSSGFSLCNSFSFSVLRSSLGRLMTKVIYAIRILVNSLHTFFVFSSVITKKGRYSDPLLLSD